MSEINTSVVEQTEQERRDFGNWLVGFTDGEGCFQLMISKNKPMPDGLLRSSTFRIGLRYDDKPILEKIRGYLGCGTIYDNFTACKIKSTTNPSAEFRVADIKDLATKIVPFFEKFQLRSKKKRDFDIWKKGVEVSYLVNCKPRIYKSYGYGYEPKWLDKDKERFSELDRQLKEVRIPNDNSISVPCDVESGRDFRNWFTGLTDGEGSFGLGGYLLTNGKSGRHISFRIALRYDDSQILDQIRMFLGCGNITFSDYPKKHNKNANMICWFTVDNSDDLFNKLVPLFDKHPLRAKKLEDYIVWKEGVQLAWEKTKDDRGMKGFGKGSNYKWDYCDMDIFMQLVNELKETRRYKGPKDKPL